MIKAKHHLNQNEVIKKYFGEIADTSAIKKGKVYSKEHKDLIRHVLNEINYYDYGHLENPKFDYLDMDNKTVLDQDVSLNNLMAMCSDIVTECGWAVEKDTGGLMRETKKSLLEHLPLKGIVFSTWRSGYGFVGSIFERNPNIFYLHEPFTQIKDLEISKVHKLTTEFYDQCHIPMYSDYWSTDEFHNYLIAEKHVDCYIDNICYRTRGHKFRSEPVCKEDLTQIGIYPENLHAWCPFTEDTFPILDKVCHESKIRLIHTTDDPKIMLNKIDYKYLNDPNYTILLFVRDPRAITHSVMNILNELYFDFDFTKKTCDSWNYVLEMKALNRWRARINIIRYEDFLVDADYQFQELLNHFALPYSKADEHFVFQTTHSGQPRKEFGFSEEEPWKPGNVKLEWLVTNETSDWTWNTIHMSAQTGFKWAMELKYRYVQKVQKLCGEVMEKLAYKIFDENEYFSFRNYTKKHNHEYAWDMKLDGFPISQAYTLSHRQKAINDEEYAQNFRKKYWGWDD